MRETENGSTVQTSSVALRRGLRLTAVALSIDIDLPEGRRVMMLAPYYVALKTTVNDISWDPNHDALQFRLPPGRRW